MNKYQIFNIPFILLLLLPFSVRGQSEVEFLGLADKNITTMSMYYSIIAVGTNGNGVFYQYVEDLPDSGWINAGLENKNITAVYPHKSGPVGWGLTAGAFPEADDMNYVFCSFMGDDFTPNSRGISDSLADRVYSLAGFPDPTICGEKYAATGGALYRQFYGDTLWSPVFTSLGMEGSGVIQVKTKEDIGGLVLAGGSEGYTGVLLVKSVDYGDTWEHIYPPDYTVNFDFETDSSRSDFQTIFVSHGNRISRSPDGGNNWDIVYENSLAYIQDVVFEQDASLVVAAGSEILDSASALLIYSFNLGDSWDRVPLNINNSIVDIAFSWDGYIYFATPDEGVFRISNENLSIDARNIPLSFSLNQNYPNPFNPVTTIHFDLPESGDVELVIYDVLGREVEKLVNGRLVSGEYKIKWDAFNFPSGIYIYRLTVTQNAVLRYEKASKLILLK